MRTAKFRFSTISGWQNSLISFALLLSFFAISPTVAQERETPTRKTSFAPEVREQLKRAISAVGLVLVRSASDPEQKLRPRGSAVIIRKDGLVVTNFHVVARDRSTRLYEEIFFSLPSDPSIDATKTPNPFRLKPVLTNQDRDLALLQVVAEKSDTPVALPFVEIGDSHKMELLDDIFIIGFPEKGGTTLTLNPGVVEGRDALDDWIKTNGRLLHGNSGGAAVNSAGKLIGIPTRVVVDSDAEKTYGSVGYLRPSHLVAAMISQFQEAEMNAAVAKKMTTTTVVPTGNSNVEPKSTGPITISGLVKSADGKPLAGVRVGLLMVGKEVMASNLITWGGSNAEGRFVLEKPVPPGRYNLRAKVVGYEAFSLDVDITSASIPIVINLKPQSQQ